MQEMERTIRRPVCTVEKKSEEKRKKKKQGKSKKKQKKQKKEKKLVKGKQLRASPRAISQLNQNRRTPAFLGVWGTFISQSMYFTYITASLHFISFRMHSTEHDNITSCAVV